MIEKPQVRIATAHDKPGMVSLLHAMWEENGVASLSVPKMLQALDRGLARDRSIIGVIEKDGIIMGSIGLFVSSMWYSDDYHVEDLWNFVHPAHRHSSYARDLLNFAKKTCESLDTQLLIAVLSSTRTQAKVRMYEKIYGPSLGAIFCWPAVSAQRPPALEVVANV